MVTYNGRMIENLHVESAQRTLSMHDAITALQAERTELLRPAPGSACLGEQLLMELPFEVPRQHIGRRAQHPLRAE